MPPAPLRFGVFELDPAARELRKRGVRIRLQDQPFRVLEALLEKPGQVVTREELKDRLWAQDEFVEFDKSLNTAIQKIRQALGDSAESPRFLETIPRKGYRFLGAVEGSQSEPPPPAQAGSKRSLLYIGAAAVLSGIVFWLGLSLGRHSQRSAPDRKLVRFSVESPQDIHLDEVRRPIAISPDGARLAIVVGKGESSLWVHDFAGLEPRRFDDTAGAYNPFWSPDSRTLGYFSDEKLHRIPVDGGAPSVVCDLPGYTEGAAWSIDSSSIVFGSGPNLYEVPAIGGKPQIFVSQAEIEAALGKIDGVVSYPHFVGADSKLQGIIFGFGTWAEGTLLAKDLRTGQIRKLGAGSRPVYAHSGHLLYQPSALTHAIWALPFSLEAMSSTGQPFPLAQPARDASVSIDGTMAYLDGSESPQNQLAWFDRSGKPLGSLGPPAPQIWSPAISRSGAEVAAAIHDGVSRDLWIYDSVTGGRKRLTSAPVPEHFPQWGPRDEKIAFTAYPPAQFDIFVTPADGSQKPTPLIPTPDHDERVSDWSEDGRIVVFSRDQDAIGYLSRDNRGRWTSHRAFDSPFRVDRAKLSPDGRFLAYVSNETGQYEVYVRPFPSGGTAKPISTNGGSQPRWSRDGTELFYTEGPTLVAAKLSRTGEVLSRTPLFDHPGLRGSGSPSYDVDSSGRKFVLVERTSPRDGATPIRVVQNWVVEFQQGADAR